MQALAAEARAAVSDVGVVRGILRIGSMETTAAVRLPELLARFYRAYPEVQIEVRTGPTAELLEHVLAHRLDGALVAGPIHHPDLLTRLAFREELVLVTALGSTTMSERLAQGGLTVITFRQGCSYRQRLDAEFMTRGWLPFRRLEMGTVDGILAAFQPTRR
jgi:DNA-binding transcriptional LysR family regulator